MKNKLTITPLIKTFVIIILVITACTKDDEATIFPSITILNETGYISKDTLVSVGEEMSFKVKLDKGDLNITNFLINVFTDETQTYFDTGMNTASFIWEGNFIKSTDPEERWDFIVRDSDGNSSSISLYINLDTNSNYQSLESFSSIDMGAPENITTGGCFNPSNGNMYFHFDVAEDTSLQAGIDLLYFYADEDKNTISSPGANIDDGIFPVNPGSWTVVNTSRYFKTSLTVLDFANANNDSIILANYNEADAKRKAKNLQEDDIYTFKTQQGLLGIFIVNEVTGTTEGSINIDLKIQQ
ncbi:MAG: hypothetical protein ABFS05_03785 [Bacteroidota bacterium]